MKAKRFRVAIVALLCFGMTTTATAAPVSVVAPPVMQRPSDVALLEGGVLVGQMLNGQGAAVVNAPVSVQSAGKEIARVNTDKQGKFRVTGLRGGVHLVATTGQQAVYRLWAPRTAPPAAQRGLMLVHRTDVIRGQSGCGAPVSCGSPVCGSSCGCGAGGIGGWMADHPILTAGAIASAIAIPLALDDDDAPASP